MNKKPGEIRIQIADLVRKYYREVHEPAQRKTFEPGRDIVHYAGRIYDEKEMVAAVDCMLDFWLTLGDEGKKFEKEFARYLRTKCALLTNSGSSANLLAMSTLKSNSLEDRLEQGDEVITVAASFPTTVAPIAVLGLVPVFIDIELGSYNIDVTRLEEARSKKTRAIFVAHTLGNPFNLDAVIEFAKKHDLYVIEDNCDALGAKWDGKFTGTFGDLATSSFFPAHHMTAGEGGAVYTENSKLFKIAQSLRSWGRDCWCEPGVSNTCGKRFSWDFKGLPKGYDHKNTYTEIGYNLKPLDVQAAILLQQLKKLPDFIEQRKKNFRLLDTKFREYADKFITPISLPKADPSWFGYIISVKEDAGFTRDEIMAHFEKAKVETRPLFAGNITRHPAYSAIPQRKVGDLKNSDFVMNNTFWIGVYPGLNDEKIRYIGEKLDEFMAGKRL